MLSAERKINSFFSSEREITIRKKKFSFSIFFFDKKNFKQKTEKRSLGHLGAKRKIL